MLLDGTAAAKEGNDEDNNTNNDQEDGCISILAVSECQVVAVFALYDRSNNNEAQTTQL